MSDGAGGAAGAVAGAVEQGAQASQESQPQGGGAAAAPEGAGGGENRWQDKFLPEEMRADDTLGRYKDIPSLAKGLLETREWARGRVPVPGTDATEEQWTEFTSKVRPAKAEDYEIAVPQGQSADFADRMRPVFHNIGLHARQAKALSEAYNQDIADQTSRLAQGNRDELTAIELEMGESAYNQRLTAVGNMMAELGFTDFRAIDALQASFTSDGKPGAGQAMKLLFAMAERTGELAKVDGDTVDAHLGRMTAAQAQEAIQRMDADPEVRAKVMQPNSAEARKRDQLMSIARKGG